MRWNDIRKQASALGIRAARVKKPDLIRAVQRAEGNFDCFGRASGYCDRGDCAWRSDCLGQGRKTA